MPAASTPSSGAASTDARRRSGDPAGKAGTRDWKVDLRELGRRAGSMREWEKTVPAPERWGVEMIAVPQGAPV
jgi:uncharacterized protein